MFKIVALGVGLAASFVAQKGIDLLWKRIAGHDAPTGDIEDKFSEVVVFAGVAGVVTAAVQHAAVRKAAKVYQRAGGRIGTSVTFEK